MKYLGFTEVYTYSLVSEAKFEGPLENALKIKNPLSVDMHYLRNSLISSLLQVVQENKSRDSIKIFELSNVYLKQENNLPKETLMFSGIYKKDSVDFYEVKGIIEEVLKDLGLKNLIFKNSKNAGLGASIYFDKNYLGEIEILDNNLINFDINFSIVLQFANVKKQYTPIARFPGVHEDISIITDVSTQDIIKEVSSLSDIIADVYLKDSYKESRTFHITYQHSEKNLTKDDVSKIRIAIIEMLKQKLKAEIRE